LSLKPSLSNTSVDSKGKLIKPIQWTGGIIHLIELAHGIHLREQVNNGSIGIVDFFVSLRDFLESIWVFPKKVLTISKQGSAEEDRIHRPDQVIPFEKMVEEDEIFKKSVKEFENPVQPQYLHDALFLYR
jgi:RteC protein.